MAGGGEIVTTTGGGSPGLSWLKWRQRCHYREVGRFRVLAIVGSTGEGGFGCPRSGRHGGVVTEVAVSGG